MPLSRETPCIRIFRYGATTLTASLAGVRNPLVGRDVTGDVILLSMVRRYPFLAEPA